jgi:hypothetical protein
MLQDEEKARPGGLEAAWRGGIERRKESEAGKRHMRLVNRIGLTESNAYGLVGIQCIFRLSSEEWEKVSQAYYA